MLLLQLPLISLFCRFGKVYFTDICLHRYFPCFFGRYLCSQLYPCRAQCGSLPSPSLLSVCTSFRQPQIPTSPALLSFCHSLFLTTVVVLDASQVHQSFCYPQKLSTLFRGAGGLGRAPCFLFASYCSGSAWQNLFRDFG